MSRSHALLAATVVALGLGLHLIGLAGLRQVSQDDVISVLAATGHQGEYQAVVDNAQAPLATWVPAAEWQRFVRVEDRLPLLRIARDLGHEDIHPPVYFWLLHLWLLAVGVSLWSGPALNLLIHGLTAVALWRLARKVLADRRAAWAVTGVWVTLPAVIESSLATRQYSLASLWAVLLCDQVVGLDHGARRRRVALIAGLTGVGLLTLYPFACVVLGLATVLLVRLRDPRSRPPALAALAALAAGGALLTAAQPWLREVLARQRDQAQPFSGDLPGNRLALVWRELPRFVLADARGLTAVALLTVALAITVEVLRSLRRVPVAAGIVVGLGLWTLAMLVAAYLAALSPAGAYQARYFTIALPFLAFLPVLAVWSLRHQRAVAVAAAVLAAVVVSANGAWLLRQAGQPPAQTLTGQSPVVVDNLARGVLLRVLWDAPADTRVYAADQKTLLLTQSRWLDCDDGPCAETPVVYVTRAEYEATERGRSAILAEAAQTRRVTRIEDVGDVAERYWLTPRAARAQRLDEPRPPAAGHHPPGVLVLGGNLR